MNSLGILEVIFPETADLMGLNQGGFHHLDAWAHSLQTLAELERLLKTLDTKIYKKYSRLTHAYLNKKVSGSHSRLWLLKLACILHDIGKPATRFAGQDGKIHFYGHEKTGANIVKKIGQRLKLSAKEVGVLHRLVLHHLRAGQIVNDVPSNRAKFRFFRDTQDNAVMIILLTIADRNAMQGVLSRKKSFVFLEDELFKMIVGFFKNVAKNKAMPRLLNGNEIIRLLDLRPSPLVGKLLKEVEEAQELNIIQNKKQARQMVKDMYAAGKKK